MANVSIHNDKYPKYSKRGIFNSRTFNSKLFIKLASPYIDQSIVTIQTLRYEQENRKLSEIEKALPWLESIPELKKFINLKESPERAHKLLIELTWVLFYKYYKKNSILKKAAENEQFFYILLGGKILRLNIIYERVSMTLEDYLIYLFKMKLIHEKEILNKCRLLNNFYANINADNLHKFCHENPQFNYDKIKETAKQEIINLGFKIEDFQEEKITINSINNYIKIANVSKHTKKLSDGLKATPKFYLGKYVKSGYISRGQAIGNLTEELISDNCTYICVDNCDIGLIDKNNSKVKTLYKLIIEKKIKILSEIKKDFFIFNQITDKVFYNEIVPYFEYKHFHQGENIFLQNSFYEGIYLIKKGEVKIYLNSAVNDIGNYISKIKYSLCGFKEYISILNIKNYNNNPKDEILVKPKIIDAQTKLTREKCDILYEIKKYDILNIPEYSIFGTNELYDYKTGLYYFSAECISKEAIVYFLPKKYFYSLLIKEKPIYLALMEMVESKVKFIIGKLKYHIKCFEVVMNKKNKKFENNKLNPLNLNDINYNNFMYSFKNLQRNNLTISDNNIPIIKSKEKSCEFPPLVSLVKDIKYKYKNEMIKRNNILGQTISSFSFKEKNHRTIKEKTINNNYKKIDLRAFHPTSLNLYNKRMKSYEKKFFIRDDKKIHSILRLNLPNNFPYNVQNSYYNSTLCPIK